MPFDQYRSKGFYCTYAINCTDLIAYIVQKLKSSLREFCLKKGDWVLGSADI